MRIVCYLNIWAPIKPEDKRPVLFWIHGGGYFNGCGTMNYYDGRFFAEKGIIVVTINYRLGALGFLGLKTLYDQYHTTGNWGTLDQIAALKWVNKNIEAFGGDPQNVTIAGESAGSFSISNLILSPMTKGLFRRAILESGSLFANKASVPYTRAQLDATMKMSREYAKSLGVDDTKEGLDKLREMDAMMLWKQGYFSSNVTDDCPFAFWATLDGTVIPTDPYKELKEGNYNKADYLIGYNKQEGICFIPDEAPREKIKAYFEKVFTHEDIEKIKEIFKEKDIFSVPVARDIITLCYFKAGMTFMKDELSSQGNVVYAYEFDFAPDGNYPMAYMGAHHAAEIPFVFGTSDFVGVHYSKIGEKVEDFMHAEWSNFIKTGNPNSPQQSIQWKAYTKEEPYIYIFDEKCYCEKERSYQDIHKMWELMH